MRDIKKKLFFILSSYWEESQGGAELQAFYLELEAFRQQWETHYCFLSNKMSFNHSLPTKLCPIPRRYLWRRLGNIKYPYGLHLLRKLKKNGPDFIYQRCGSALTGIAAYYAKKSNCKMIFHVAHDKDTEKAGFSWKKLYKIPEIKLMQYGIRNADIIIAQTKFQAQQLRDNYGRESIVIPNGHPVPNDCVKKQDCIQVLWIANFRQIKQPDVFVKLAKECRHTGVRFIMLGRTQGYEKLVAKAESYGVEVLGEVSNDDVNLLLEKSHVLVNTSIQEGFSNTFIQAWMRRAPVVSLHVDPDGILQREKIGSNCSGCFGRLVKETERLIRDHDLRNQMGANARTYAVKNYSLTNFSKILCLMEDYR